MPRHTLTDLGWSAHFNRQINDDDTPARVSAVHRNGIDALTTDGIRRLSVPAKVGPLATGDWVVTSETGVTRRLERQTALSRRAAGTDAREQLIAANVTTLGIVTSCNADFNPARIERYLVLATDAGCLPLVILTKADQTDDPRPFLRQVERLSPLLTAIAVDATDPDELARLAPWCRTGETLALVGSSGVGKTTLRNGLTGDAAATRTIRQDDAKGRHTTTARELVQTAYGGWLIDTPGMRALRLADVSEGISTIFDDIEALARACRFNDCAHQAEPGCAVQNAIASGTLDPDRLRRWEKLKAEEARNSETIAEARARDKGFGKMVRNAMADKEGRRRP